MSERFSVYASTEDDGTLAEEVIEGCATRLEALRAFLSHGHVLDDVGSIEISKIRGGAR